MERLVSSAFVLFAWCLHLLRSEEMPLRYNVSQEPILPTPLNQSQWLIEEGNNKSKFESNTSDNNTQEMMMRYRERSEEALLPVNVSQDHIFPTPLILNLNQSVAQWLIEEANNMSKFVSNTSWSDVLSDNATQQMVMRYRERKRQARLMTIQRDILFKLGFTRGPNVTDRLSAEERQSLVQSFDRTMIERTDSSEDENNSTTPWTEADTEAQMIPVN